MEKVFAQNDRDANVRRIRILLNGQIKARVLL